MIETCPLLDELDWIRHGFWGCGDEVSYSPCVGILPFKPVGDVFFMPQQHTDAIITPNDPVPANGADASVTDKVNLGLAIRTADCVPLLLVCTKTRLIAGVHSGWRSTLANITQKTVDRMIQMGATPATIRAALGPSIHQQDFPVQDDVRIPFLISQPDTAPYFIPFEDRYKLDVAGVVMHQLRRCGVNQIWASDVNTFNDSRCFSYRRHCKDPSHPFKSNISVIMRTN
jgi:YfiH family protein